MSSDFADLDITTLSLHDLTEYRQELVHAILHPGIEYEEADNESRKKYKAKLADVDAYLATQTGSPAGGNLP